MIRRPPRSPPFPSTPLFRSFTADRTTTLVTLPIGYGDGVRRALTNNADVLIGGRRRPLVGTVSIDRKSTRLNSSHANISYAVFCLKKKTHTPDPESSSFTSR